MAEESKRLKMQEKEDRISALPDSLIQHILSFLPSTKDAIQTSVLSKRWHNQWTRVPVLIFYDSDICTADFSRFIDNTLLLHDCSKIQKFHIQSAGYDAEDDPHFNSKLRFATRKDVEELILELHKALETFRLPDFLFNHASLIKLQMYNCEIIPNQSVSWEKLKVLNIERSTLSDEAIVDILNGSPLLESLELRKCFGFDQLVIASKSLKKLVMRFEVKKTSIYSLQISCPKLEKLKLLGSVKTMYIQVEDLSSLVCATLDFDCDVDDDEVILVEILEQLQHVKELTLGSRFIECLQNLWESGEDAGLSSLLNNKSLTLDQPDFGNHSAGIATALRISNVIEKLVIQEPIHGVVDLSNNFWHSNQSAFKCLVPHLKTVYITGLPKRTNSSNVPFDFVDFLLKNTAGLEKLVILKDGGSIL